MTDEHQTAQGEQAEEAGLSREACRESIIEGLYRNNPVVCQVLGICSCLAVTNRVANALVMGGALIFVLTLSNLIVSLLRKQMPHRIRMIAEVAVIATFVIFFDQFLKAFYWSMSVQLGPYVGLIITNCIVMGRAEAYAIDHPPLMSMVDGAANAVGFALVITAIAVVRELVGAGSILGYHILSSSWYHNNLIFVLAPGAFFTAGFLIWILNAIRPTSTSTETH